MNKKKKSSLILFLILLTLLIIAFFILRKNKLNSFITYPSSASNTSSSIKNWKTYRNDMFKYELKYPQEWYVLEGAGPVTSFSNNQSGEGDSAILVSIFRNTDVSMDSLKSRKKYFADKPEEFKILKDITVDGKPGFEVEFIKNRQREAIIALNPDAQYSDFFTVFVIYNEKQKDQAIDIYQKMLATFKLVN